MKTSDFPSVRAAHEIAKHSLANYREMMFDPVGGSPPPKKNDMKVTIEREVLQAAIDALKRDAYGENNSSFRVIDALRAALAQPAEPVALVESVAMAIYDQWGHLPGYKQWVIGGNSLYQDDARCVARRAVAAAPPTPAAVPLTDEQIDELMSAANLSRSPEGWTVDAWVVHHVARGVEAAHGISAGVQHDA